LPLVASIKIPQNLGFSTYQDVLLGREVVFDLFDVEFKQADEKIV